MSTVYLETTIPSYLSKAASTDQVFEVHRSLTWQWWKESRREYDCFVSEAVIKELSLGTPDAASRRLAFVSEIPILAVMPEIETMAREYLGALRLPDKAIIDAVHLSYVIRYRVDYLLTWNCKHLANGVVRRRLQEYNVPRGVHLPVIVTPEELLTSNMEEL